MTGAMEIWIAEQLGWEDLKKDGMKITMDYLPSRGSSTLEAVSTIDTALQRSVDQCQPPHENISVS